VSRTAAEVRAEIGHPVLDADGHTIEVTQVLLDYIDHEGGPDAVDRYRRAETKRQFVLDDRVPPWTQDSGAWVWPTRNTLDRATATLPALYAERLDEFGIDVALIYPSEGLFAPNLADDELRVVACRAYNAYVADGFGPHRDRLIPAAVIPMHTPGEAVAEIHHAVDELGMKVVVLRSHVPRRTSDGRQRLDFLALGSDYDYDPVWAACVEANVAATFHTSAIYGGRAQVANYVYNHIGTLAAGGEAICKALFMGGVTKRFPELRFAFLEGGAGWAVNLFADLVSHWERRSAGRIGDFDPANLDVGLLIELVQRHGDERARKHLGDIEAMFSRPQAQVSNIDNFSAVPMETAREMLDLFVAPFWFGCEADDPVTVHAFNREANPFGAKLQAVLGSDNGHWDVPDMAGVLPEAFELVDRGLLDADDFERFVFSNAVRLHAGMNPDFFRGTRLEAAIDARMTQPAVSDRP